MKELKGKANKVIAVIYFVIAALGIFYDAGLIIRSPGTFLDNLTSFTHIWTILGAFFIFAGIYRLKKGHSFWKDCKRWLKITLVTLFSLGVIIASICLGFIYTPKLASLEETAEPAPYMILLGGGIDKNGKLPLNVINRVNAAADYLKVHKETVCVVSGGTLKWLPVAEAPEIKRQLVNAGIEPERILVEDQAKDTIENFEFSCKMLAEYDGVSQNDILNSPVVVVTNYFHLRRSERLAERMGYKDIKGIGAKCDPFTALHIYVREIGAYIKLNLRILLTGKPETLFTK